MLQITIIFGNPVQLMIDIHCKWSVLLTPLTVMRLY